MLPGRPEHVLDDPLTNVWRNVVIPSRKIRGRVGLPGEGRLNFPAMRRTGCASYRSSAEIEGTGAAELVKPGDAFIIPQGSRTVWRIEKYVKEILPLRP